MVDLIANVAVCNANVMNYYTMSELDLTKFAGKF